VHPFPLLKLKNWLFILLAISLVGCKKNQAEIPVTTAVEKAIPVTVTINQNQPGYAISPAFEGLSYETGLLGESPDFLNENNAVVIQLIKNLGKGVLRIGGNTSDETNWTGSVRTNATPPNSLTTTDVDHLAAFADAIGWPVIFGLNLGTYDPSAAASEALYVHSALQGNLYAFQSGNEPDVFSLGLRKPSYNYNNFQHEWSNYFTAVKNAVPKAHFAGPDVDPFNPSWISSFANNEHSNVGLIDGHYYNCGPASDAAINYHDILMPNQKLDGYLLQLSKISAQYRLPYRISECNSVWGGGKPGVSDVFASALWALDFMWTVAENKGQGINFHGGGERFAYTPIGVENGVYSARPEYYGMLAFKYGSTGGTIVPATITDPRNYNNCSAYACVNADGIYTITLINKEDKKNFNFTIQLSKTASAIEVSRLMAPSITAKTGITFAGNAVNTDGTFTPQPIEQNIFNKKAFVVGVPAGSAVVITVK
jgi:hypothetical protein